MDLQIFLLEPLQSLPPPRGSLLACAKTRPPVSKQAGGILLCSYEFFLSRRMSCPTKVSSRYSPSRREAIMGW